jgi:hypothetical protein
MTDKTDKTLQDILEKLANAQRGNMGNYDDYIELCSIDEAKTAIKEWVRGKVPKKMSLKEINPFAQTITELGYAERQYMEGYNQAIADFLKAIEEE